ncbi:hypothetical protein [Cytophaga sp. FL35]|uniref:hypothetical protein n=1 Tax=Cytophaga sp. FL35 TaxID=1904456 RepID=UPI00165368E0|nr:hypothetical protein [Cytophaga sp. FL35]MBC6999955.1 hypothetical protein [Cytophaga sp. FL35]
MKKVIKILFIIVCHSVNAQVDNNIPIFHRLLLLNAQNELMVVKIENTDFWVTPGLYQSKEQTIKNGLDSIASTYGLKLKEIHLKGTFMLKRELNGASSTSLRNVYTAKVQKGMAKKHEGISEIKWLSVDEVMKTITFPHINLMVKQIMSKPNDIWGGTLLQFKENDLWRAKVLEEFYRL